MITNKHTPYLYFKSGLFSFPDVNVCIKSNFRGEPFLILNSDIETEFRLPTVGGGGSFTRYKPLIMQFSKDTTSMEDTIRSANKITCILSLLSGSYWFDLSSLGPYVFPGSLRSNHPIEDWGEYHGLKIANFELSNVVIDDLLNRINKLTENDLKFFTSASFLVRQAKKSFYRGEDSKSVADAISAVEALYTRPIPGTTYYNDADTRFQLPTGRERRFKTLIERTDTNLYTSLPKAPYTIRSGHLHAGELDLYFGKHPREANEFLEFIEGCQQVILDNLTCFGV